MNLIHREKPDPSEPAMSSVFCNIPLALFWVDIVWRLIDSLSCRVCIYLDFLFAKIWNIYGIIESDSDTYLGRYLTCDGTTHHGARGEESDWAGTASLRPHVLRFPDPHGQDLRGQGLPGMSMLFSLSHGSRVPFHQTCRVVNWISSSRYTLNFSRSTSNHGLRNKILQ